MKIAILVLPTTEIFYYKPYTGRSRGGAGEKYRQI